MFTREINTRKHYTGKDGEDTYLEWCKLQGINAEDFPFRVKTMKTDRKGRHLNMNVVSWGFYQGSDWQYYVFVSYRTSNTNHTCAYHWDVDSEGKPIGTPRKHEWCN